MEREPHQQEIEKLEVDEESSIVSESDAPEDVKSEVLERLERFEEADIENESADGAPGTG